MMALHDDVRHLTSLPAFRALDREAVRLIAFSAETRILRTGDILFRHGETSDGGFVLLSGAIGLVEADGSETMVRAPAALGELAMITETSWIATATAREATSVIKIPRVVYLRILAEYPWTAQRVRTAAASRLLALRDELKSVQRTMEAA